MKIYGNSEQINHDSTVNIHLHLYFAKFEWSKVTNDAVIGRSEHKTFFVRRHWILQLAVQWSHPVVIDTVQQQLTVETDSN